MCKDCHKTFTARNNTITFSSKKSFATWKKYIDCMMNGFTVRKSAKICGINKDTAFIWRHKILDALQNMASDVKLDGIVEADETFFAISFKGNHKKSTNFRLLFYLKAKLECIVDVHGTVAGLFGKHSLLYHK